MSPSGRLKLASMVRIANKKLTNVKKACSFMLLFSVFTLITFCEAFPSDKLIRESAKTTTPAYDGDYYENGMFNSFDAKFYSEALPADGEIKERIIPIKVQSVKLAESIHEEYLDEVKMEISQRGKVVIDRKVEVGEVKTYCSGFESKCRCSADGKELTCKAAGFVEVPSSLPSTLTKL